MEKKLRSCLIKWAMTCLAILMVATLTLSIFLTITAGILLIGSSVFANDQQPELFAIPIFDGLTIAIGLIMATGLVAALVLSILIIATTSVRLPCRPTCCYKDQPRLRQHI